MELYNIYTYIAGVDDDLKYAWSARFNDQHDADAAAYEQALSEYEDCEGASSVISYDEILQSLIDLARERGIDTDDEAAWDEIEQDAEEQYINVRNDTIEYQAIRAVDDERDYEDIYDLDDYNGYL